MPDHEKPSPPPALAGGAPLAEVRYSLPALLREVQLERAAAAFTMERLDQMEITKLFEKRKPRRALKRR